MTQPHCKVIIKKTGQQCRRYAVIGYEVCQYHGAGSPYQGRPGGITKKSMRSATASRHSKFLPSRLAAYYEASENDPELLSMRSELHLIDTRIAEILNRVDTGEAGKYWAKIKESYQDLSDALYRKDSEGVNINLRSMGMIISKGTADYAVWNEITELVEQRRKLVESEQRRVEKARLILRVDEAAKLMGALTSAVRKHVTDDRVLIAIQQEFVRLSSTSNIVWTDEPEGGSESINEIEIS